VTNRKNIRRGGERVVEGEKKNQKTNPQRCLKLRRKALKTLPTISQNRYNTQGRQRRGKSSSSQGGSKWGEKKREKGGIGLLKKRWKPYPSSKASKNQTLSKVTKALRTGGKSSTIVLTNV